MKTLTKILFTFLILHFAFLISNGQNLVPNPSFEDTIYCPSTNNDVGAAVNWFNAGNSPDYFNACATIGSNANLPNAFTGYQFANTGDAITGVFIQSTNLSPGGANYREYIGTQLITPLIISQKYYLSFFINYSGYLNGFKQIAANKIGMKFTTYPYSEFSPPITDNFAHLYTDSILTDTLGWFKISGSFIADSNYQFVTLGNFFDSITTDTVDLGGTLFGSASAYYFIDDVCVSTDSITCLNPVGIQSIIDMNNNYNVFASNNYLTVTSDKNLPFNFSLYDIYGRLIYKSVNELNTFRYNTSSLKPSIYVVHIYNKSENYTQKIFINH